jgi:hypothetical protein
MGCDRPLARARHRFRALDVSAARPRLNTMPFVRRIGILKHVIAAGAVACNERSV